MDPQQRLLLEETLHCIEDSGIPLELLQHGSTSVYIGYMTGDYKQMMNLPGVKTESYSGLGNNDSLLANRISHYFDLNGPSLSFNAACASSLVALHEAKRTLINGECNYAIAGGVNLNIVPSKYISFSKDLNFLD